MVGFAFLQPILFSCYHLLSYHSIIPTVKLFASILLGFFGPAVYSSPNGPVRQLVLLLYHWRAPVSHLFSLRYLGLVCFPWASSTIFLTLHSYELLLNYLGFPGPITLSLILGVHGFAINPLLYLLSLFWACRSTFSLFHIIYCPCLLFLSFRTPLSLFTSSRPICLFHGPVIHYSCRLGLMGFLSICQLFYVRVASFSFPLGLPKWPSTFSPLNI